MTSHDLTAARQVRRGQRYLLVDGAGDPVAGTDGEPVEFTGFGNLSFEFTRVSGPCRASVVMVRRGAFSAGTVRAYLVHDEDC